MKKKNMHKIETLLFGIALILFGIAALIVAFDTGMDIAYIIGTVSPIAGLISSIIGLFDNGGKKGDEE